MLANLCSKLAQKTLTKNLAKSFQLDQEKSIYENMQFVPKI